MNNNGSTVPGLPRQAAPLRRLLHLLVAAAGWVVFVYWWWLVFGRVTRQEITFTVTFIVATAVVTTGVTLIWSAHNKRIHRRKKARIETPPTEEEYRNDRLMRELTFVGGVEFLREESWVQVQVNDTCKIYVPGTSAPGIAASDGRSRIRA